MKWWFALYWLIGCLIVGHAVGDRIRECPSVRIDMVQIVAIVAVWPMMVTIGGSLPHQGPACD